MKQTVTATSTNHAELLAFHKAARECIWLRTMERIINQQCRIQEEETKPTVIFEDNVACIRQMSSDLSRQIELSISARISLDSPKI